MPKKDYRKRAAQSLQKRSRQQSHQKRRRLFLLATVFVARGMDPDKAYKMVLYYVDGPGHGPTWIGALAEQNKKVNAHAPEP